MINIMEIIITIVIVAFAVSIIYRSFRKSSKGDCNCGSCSTHCPMYKDKDTSIKIQTKAPIADIKLFFTLLAYINKIFFANM